MIPRRTTTSAMALGRQMELMKQSFRVPSCNWSGMENPYTQHFKKKPSRDFPKQTTGLTGILVSERPHHELKTVYKRILRALSDMPETSAYRKYTEGLIKQRLHLVDTEPDIAKLEEKIGMGQIEEVLQQALNELKCARDMDKFRVWEPLAAKAPEDQWRWPI